MESRNINLQGRQRTGREDKIMIADLFVHLGIATGSALYSISNNTSCLISLNIYTKHFFTGTLPKLS